MELRASGFSEEEFSLLYHELESLLYFDGLYHTQVVAAALLDKKSSYALFTLPRALFDVRTRVFRRGFSPA